MNYTIYIKPEPKGRPRAGKWGVYTPAKTRKYESAVKSMLQNEMLAINAEKIFGPFTIFVCFYFKRPKKPSKPYPSRGDLDNYAKAILDAANGLLFDDDSDCVCLCASKEYSDVDKIHIKIEREKYE